MAGAIRTVMSVGRMKTISGTVIRAGVRVFYYLEGRERTLESPTDKLLLSVTGFSDEMEPERAR
jgi:hypothetical protein